MLAYIAKYVLPALSYERQKYREACQ